MSRLVGATGGGVAALVGWSVGRRALVRRAAVGMKNGLLFRFRCGSGQVDRLRVRLNMDGTRHWQPEQAEQSVSQHSPMRAGLSCGAQWMTTDLRYYR